MKKILFASLIVLFVSTLFVGCPIQPQNPPKDPKDTTDIDSIKDILDDIYQYLPKEFYEAYIPYEVGDSVCFSNNSDTMNFVVYDRSYNFIDNFCVDTLKNNDIRVIKFQNLYFDVTLTNPTSRIVFLCDITLNVQYPRLSPCLISSLWFYLNDNSVDISCSGDCSECASEVFFNNIISISQDGKNVSAVIENGKGIIQFMDEEGINWHLVE